VADLLVVEIEADLVSRRRLTGEADRLDQLRGGPSRGQTSVLVVVPGRLIAGIQVPEESRDLLLIAIAADVVVEPQPILHDWSAEREVRVPVLDQRGDVGQTEAFQFIGEVVTLRPLARGAEKAGAAERIAARLRNQVELRTTAIDFTKSTRDRDLNL